MKSITIIIPIYNEEEALPHLFPRLRAVLDGLPGYAAGVLFVDDGSRDGSVAALRLCGERDSRFRWLSLARNYGKETAMLAGLDYSRTSDAVVFLDADLQDPPELIPEMVAEWEKGYDDVYARRNSRAGESGLKKLTSAAYYRVLGRMSDVPIQRDTGDFRLLDRRCVEALCRTREVCRCSKSLFSWIGYRKKELRFDRAERVAGKTKWNYPRLARLAVDGITSLSTAPLIWPLYLGALLLAGGLLTGGALLARVLSGAAVSGAAAVLAAVLGLGGLQSVMLGVMGIYLGRMFRESKNRPLYFVDELDGKKITPDNGEGTTDGRTCGYAYQYEEKNRHSGFSCDLTASARTAGFHRD